MASSASIRSQIEVHKRETERTEEKIRDAERELERADTEAKKILEKAQTDGKRIIDRAQEKLAELQTELARQHTKASTLVSDLTKAEAAEAKSAK